MQWSGAAYTLWILQHSFSLLQGMKEKIPPQISIEKCILRSAYFDGHQRHFSDWLEIHRELILRNNCWFELFPSLKDLPRRRTVGNCWTSRLFFFFIARQVQKVYIVRRRFHFTLRNFTAFASTTELLYIQISKVNKDPVCARKCKKISGCFDKLVNKVKAISMSTTNLF